MNERGRILKAAALGLMISLLLGGCSGKGQVTDSQESSGDDSASTTKYEFLDVENKASSESTDMTEDGTEVITFVWNDNKLDDYHAVINHVVEKIEITGQIPTGGVLFLGEGGCVRHGRHQFSDYRKSWDSASGISSEGEKYGVQITVDATRAGTQIHSIGPISGKNGYVTCFGEYQDGKWANDSFYELDQDFQLVRSVPTKLEAHGSVQWIMGDAQGNFHVLFDAGSKKDYKIISSEGELLFEKNVEGLSELCAFGGGSVALCEKFSSGNDRRISEVDLEKGELAELPVSKDETFRGKLRQASSTDIYYISPVDENQVLTCLMDGVSLYDARSGKTKKLYKWSNHGILPNSVSKALMMTDGSIGILYREGGSKDDVYLLLVPTDEKEELQTITIATTAYNSTYEKMAALFQKQYPQYIIQVKKDYDETSLLTQLGAGDGPVIIDTNLTGFEELEKLWQPLDGFLEQTGLADELIPKALEFGKIGNTTYGITQTFRLDTLVVPESGPTDWDYEGFLNALESFNGAAYADIFAEGRWTDQRERYLGMLMNGMEDNYFFDAKTGKTIFGTPAFERVLTLSKKATKCPPTESWKAILEGEALCEREYVFNVQQAIFLRRKLEAKGVRDVGFPTKDGGKHRLVSGSVLAVRRTASDEEKKVAYTFLKMCLSKEAIDSLGTSFLSVRKDVMEEDFREYEEQVELAKSLDAYTPYDPDKWPELDWEADTKFLYDMIENSVTEKQFPTGLQQVFDEEFGEYLAGRINSKTLGEHLKSRVWLYLEESK